MRIALPQFHSLTIFLSFAITTIVAAAAPSTPKQRLIIELVHRESIHSPYHNHREKIAHRAERAMKTSAARFAFLQSKLESSGPSNIDYQADIFPTTNLFYVNFSIGEPPIPQFAVMDTGSNLLWVQCLPCIHCHDQLFSPIFDPSKSSSYYYLPCETEYCNYSPRAKCNIFNQCAYNQSYINNVSSAGIMATEQLTFKTSDEGTASIPEVAFGCGNDNRVIKDRRLTGVLGLGPGRISLVTQLGSSFSYCIGNLNDPYYLHNKLILGRGARIEGNSTPIEVIQGHYFITLEAISVGEKKLDIDPKIFERKTWRRSGVLIDSGSTATWLVQAGFKPLRDEIQRLLDNEIPRIRLDTSSLCYKGIASRDLIGFPVVTFQFGGGAELVLDKDSLFIQREQNLFCMAVLPSYDMDDYHSNLSVIGMMAQQNYNVGYDITEKRLTFQRIDCELLDE